MRWFSFTKNISNRVAEVSTVAGRQAVDNRANFVVEFDGQFRLESFIEAVTFLQCRRTRPRLANVSTAPESFRRAVD